ncbi:MAG: hypothetical protein JSV37_00640 [Anaerolineaceae bacterium]|nr:MAG: hypothetical protein JSV37_00640 [Anaerolineaceae bacterium]
MILDQLKAVVPQLMKEVVAADSTVQVYLLDIEELIVLAYTRLTRWFTPEERQIYRHTDPCPPPP